MFVVECFAVQVEGATLGLPEPFGLPLRRKATDTDFIWFN